MKANRSPKDFFLFGEAWVLLACARILLVFIPFKKVAGRLGKNMTGLVLPEQEMNPAHSPMLQQLQVALHRGCRFSPWRTKCFEQAIAAKWLLQKRKLHTLLFLGVKMEERGGQKIMSAHAWLKSNNIIVTGNGKLDEYAVVGVFYN